MKKNNIKYLKLSIVLIIILGFVWFLVISPMITFHKNEKRLESAARRYYELNSNQLPTGDRIKTVSMNELYHKAFLEEDIFIPYTNKACSIDNSWVKVRKENGEYKYYTYLECGVLNSNIDHKGPEITLNGKKEITINIDSKFKDPGIKSVVDNNDGKLKTEDVTVKGEVNTSKVGSYEIQYIAFDSLNNRTVVTRKVSVVKKLKNMVKKDLGKNSNYTGNPENNFIRLSNILFRIYGLDSNDNVIIVADEDIANVNHSKIDKWLDYFYEHLSEKTKKMIVESKYCNITLKETALDTTQCTSYTDKKKVYIPSVIEVNKAQTEEENFMKPSTMSWVSNKKSSTEAYLTRDMFFYDKAGASFLAYKRKQNFGVRPMMVIKGESLIKGGNGTENDPYVFNDVKRASGGSPVNKRFSGEYILIDNTLYRIIEAMEDGTTKVISNSTLGNADDDVECKIDNSSYIYNPKDKENVAYCINNRVNEFVNTDYFENHTIKVPVYKDGIIYGEEKETKEYKAVLSAPNMYDMFSAQPQRNTSCYSYSLINSSKKDIPAIYDIGVPVNDDYNETFSTGIRVVGYLKKETTITSGRGTFDSPYIVK